MKQFIFLFTLVLLFVFADCKKETPTSPPNDDANWTAVNSGLTSPIVSALAVSPNGQAARISLPGLIAAASFFPPTTAQAGLRRVMA